MDIQNEDFILVVEGVLSNQSELQQIKLHYTLPYLPNQDGSPQNPVGLSGATVSIQDDLGNSVFFTEQNPGIYEHENYKGEVGRSYTLHIETPDGQKYQSLAEEMLPVPVIDSIRYEVVDTVVIRYDREFAVRNLKIFTFCQDPAHEQNFYKWKWTGETTLLLISNVIGPGGDFPLKCYYQYAPPPRDPYQDELTILSDQAYNGRYLSPQVLLFADDNFDFRFYYGFSMLIGQYSLTPEAYQYWEKIKKLLNNQGNIFDPAPFRVKGNIRDVNNPDNVVLGYFGASAVNYKRYTFKVTRSFNSPCIPEIKIFCGDCRAFGGVYSTTPPDYWNP